MRTLQNNALGAPTSWRAVSMLIRSQYWIGNRARHITVFLRQPPECHRNEAVAARGVHIVDRKDRAVVALDGRRVSEIGVSHFARLPLGRAAVHAEDDLVLDVPRFSIVVAEACPHAVRRPAIAVAHRNTHKLHCVMVFFIRIRADRNGGRKCRRPSTRCGVGSLGRRTV